VHQAGCANVKSSDLQRGPGRPKVISGEASSVTTWLPAKVHDSLTIEAMKRDSSVSALIRDLLTLAVSNTKSQTG
jgi:hypothetical protein